jgi:DNA-binding transcriptional MerR regulator
MSDNSKNNNNIKTPQELINTIVRQLAKMTYIRPESIPDIDLYMDQVTTFMEEHLNDSKRYSNDKILTKTMINNYAKNNLLPPPVKKKYSHDHLIMLIFIYYFKNILSISDIQSLLNPLSQDFFQSDSSPDLDKIYKEIYNYVRGNMGSLAKDILRTQHEAFNLFENVENEEQKTYLQLFSLVGMLSFDVYAKKHVIESVIDEMNQLSHNADDK